MKKTLFSTLVVLSLVAAMTYAVQKDAVKIAVASNSKDAMSSISSKAGRCPYYLIFNSKGELIEAVGNPYKDAQRQSGPQMADFLANKGVTIVIAETFGDKMIGAMKNNRIEFFQVGGVIKDAVKKVLEPGNWPLSQLDRNLSPDAYESYRKPINTESDGRKREYMLRKENKIPRRDGTGPAGMGTITGRAAGFCAGYPVPGYMNPVGRRGSGGRGRGGGWGHRNWYCVTGLPRWARAGYDLPAWGGYVNPYAIGGAPFAPGLTAQQELDGLKAQAEYLRHSLDAIKKRIEELESQKSSKE